MPAYPVPLAPDQGLRGVSELLISFIYQLLLKSFCTPGTLDLPS
jgi:hypothetical protein